MDLEVCSIDITGSKSRPVPVYYYQCEFCM